MLKTLKLNKKKSEKRRNQSFIGMTPGLSPQIFAPLCLCSQSFEEQKKLLILWQITIHLVLQLGSKKTKLIYFTQMFLILGSLSETD
jgi:hypothetical protein